ncbi:MAG: cation diffusion facilitator family transporter, partial [Spirochaetota bacterium]|nr:cation diffusion facilitator family transporter [Spirochaetota bacterium]
MDNKKAYIKKRQVTLIGVVVNILLSIIKYVIGVLSGSSALIADATHSVSDYITDMAVLVGLKLSSKPADENHPYGHGKFETFASLGVGVLLFGAAAFLIYSGITTLKALFEGQSFVKPTYYWALVAAGVSIAFKEWLYRYTIYYGKKLNSSSLIANAYHHRSDSYSSIGVMVGIVCVLISPQLAFMDPLSGIIVALLIAHMAWKISVPAFHELLDRVP